MDPVQTCPFPKLLHARPDWPSKDDNHLFFVGLHTKFCFAHHPSNLKPSKGTPPVPFFCEPENIRNQLKAVLSDSDRGSVLVTGYRGTGKTSIVNQCLDELTAELPSRPVDPRSVKRVDVNLSTVTSAHEVLVLAFEGLKTAVGEIAKQIDVQNSHKISALEQQLNELKGSSTAEAVRQRNILQQQVADLEHHPCARLYRALEEDIHQLRATRMTQQFPSPKGLPVRGERQSHAMDGNYGEAYLNYEREALSRYQARLARWVNEFACIDLSDSSETHESVTGRKSSKTRIVFVFDELDKLLPSPSALTDKGTGMQIRQAKKLEQLQRIVAELKFFLTESPSHQIFIAGKDVDDSWAEDQNKGEGIFESIFACNIYVPSIFSAKLTPCMAGAAANVAASERHAFYVTLAREIGITENSWSFSTALLILPYLAEYEVYQMLLRIANRNPSYLNTYNALSRASANASEEDPTPWLKQLQYEMLHVHGEKRHPIEKYTENSMSERTCRRLRILIEYLTYKGRGIPRKILREFYTMVQPASIVPSDDAGFDKLGVARGVVKYVLAMPQHHLQKMNFYAGIVEYLDQSFGELRGLTDKGRVSIFHIIDYILKFYTTGFSQRDVEHANFMTAREEFFPSRQLAALIIRTLEGRLWRRKDSRNPEYRLLHNVVHDLTNMFLRYPPEQMELRHTHSDFRDELERLQNSLSDVGKVAPDQRLEPVHAQMRIARILEMTGNHFEAQLAYYKALRWMRIDIDRYETSTVGNSAFPKNMGKARVQVITKDFLLPHLNYAMEALIAVGRLHEEVGEFRAAIRHYRDAENLFLDHQVFCDSLRPGDKFVNDSQLQIEKVQETQEDHISCEELLLSLRGPCIDGHDAEWKQDFDKLASVIVPPRWIAPLNIEAGPCALVEALNHTAVAYAKLWERASSSKYLLKALHHLHVSGDEYGVVDQMFFIGQIMVRRRDFRSAGLWYLHALIRIKKIRDHAEQTKSQTGADWQTPSMSTGTHAQILASFGDIVYATGGIALLSEHDVQTAINAASADKHCFVSNRSKAIAVKARADEKLRDIIRILGCPVMEDRLEEYFFTWSRYLFQAAGDQINATDVYMRQLEVRADTVKRTMSAFDRLLCEDARNDPEYCRSLKYEMLNAWSSFWRGARVLMHRHLNAPTGLTRGAPKEWGRITDFRRMGTLMRLVGEVLREVSLRSGKKSNSRRLMAIQAHYNEKVTNGKATPREHFYDWFVHETSGQTPDSIETSVICVKEVLDELDARSDLLRKLFYNAGSCTQKSWIGIFEAIDTLKSKENELLSLDWVRRNWGKVVDQDKFSQSFEDAAWFKPLLSRVGVNNAAEDIRAIFSYLSDRSDLLEDNAAKAPPVLGKIGSRSPLYHVNGSSQAALPLGFIVDQLPEGLKKRFRLLALSEKALINAYLSYRDCIPDYSYASTSILVGQLYLVAIGRLSTCYNRLRSLPSFCKCIHELGSWLVELCELAKRYFVKANDVLKREREQNRNTFHLLSEAQMNLGDVLLILYSLRVESVSTDYRGLHFESELFPELKVSSLEGQTSDCDAEDLQRQIWDAYRQGLVWALTEMDEHVGRYRSPPDIYYAHRNIMDPVLHFRICRAARLRHAGAIPAESSDVSVGRHYGFRRDFFDQGWEEISVRVASYESPQRSSGRWLASLPALLDDANRIRTDRPALKLTEGKLNGERSLTLRWIEIIEQWGRPPFTFFEAFVDLSNRSKNPSTDPQ